MGRGMGEHGRVPAEGSTGLQCAGNGTSRATQVRRYWVQKHRGSGTIHSRRFSTTSRKAVRMAGKREPQPCLSGSQLTDTP